MEIFRSFQISGSALMAEKLRVDTVASNLANIQTTRTAAGGPYRRKTVVFAEKLPACKMRRRFTGRGKVPWW